MAKRITWSDNAIADRLQILTYWFEVLGHKNYSRKLDNDFRNVIKLIARYPEIGRKSEFGDMRYFIKDCYIIYYKDNAKTIDILHIWDSRRNPENLVI